MVCTSQSDILPLRCPQERPPLIRSIRASMLSDCRHVRATSGLGSRGFQDICVRSGLAQSRFHCQGHYSWVQPCSTMPITRDRFAATTVAVRINGKLHRIARTHYRAARNHQVESLHPSLRRFAGRPMIESSGSPLLLVPGKLPVRISLSSWLTLLTGYLIFESSKQLSAGLP